MLRSQDVLDSSRLLEASKFSLERGFIYTGSVNKCQNCCQRCQICVDKIKLTGSISRHRTTFLEAGFSKARSKMPTGLSLKSWCMMETPDVVMIGCMPSTLICRKTREIIRGLRDVNVHYVKMQVGMPMNVPGTFSLILIF